MKFRERAICIFKAKNIADISLRSLAKQTNIPKSSVHRHKIKQQERIEFIGNSFFETEAGLEWMHRLFFAVIFVFGIQSGVGSETISVFFNLILLKKYVATSSSCIRDMKQMVRVLIDKYGARQIDKVLRACKDKELHLGGDETFFGESLFLILMELTSGFIFTEALVKDRKYNTWQKYAGGILKKFKKILSFTSDGACALLNLGKDVSCKNVMDLFHLLQDAKRLFATKFHSKRRSLLAKLKKLNQEVFSTSDEKEDAIAAVDNKLALIDIGQKDYRNTLFTISTQSHPFKDTFQIKSSTELEEQLIQQHKILGSIAQTCEIIDKKKLLNRFGKRIKSLARINDLWHKWVEESISCKTTNFWIKEWATSYLLPYIYFKEQFRKSKKKKRLRDYYQNLVEKAKVRLDAHLLTEEYLTEDIISWAKMITLKYQRSTSAIEGRNARLSQHYFSVRGIRQAHINSMTVIHNFWIKRRDNTTAAQRLCGFSPPDLFEYILNNINKLPLPRNGYTELTVIA